MKKVRVFAGLAAAIPPVMALAPAGTAANAAVTHGTEIRAAQNKTPRSTERGNCTAGTTHWVDLYTTYHGSICFGFRGNSVPDVYAKQICPGNNWGTVAWTSPNRTKHASPLYPGEGWITFPSSKDYVSEISIRSWSGTATCY
jgi:hypothetical protein